MISVIIPYFNARRTIVRALDSVVNQTYTDYEVIVIDDGSTDDTHKVVDNYIQKHPDLNIRHYSQLNQGPSEARNHGIRKSQGEYIAFLDADDYWMNRKLEIQIKLLIDMKLGLLGSNLNLIKPNGKTIRKYYVRGELEYISFYKLLFRHYFYTSSVVVQKDVFNASGGFPENQKYAEDTLLFTRIARNYKTAVCKDFLVNVYKPLFGASGLSANLEETNKYVLENFRILKKENNSNSKEVSEQLYRAAWLFSNLKYLRKIAISKLAKIAN